MGREDKNAKISATPLSLFPKEAKEHFALSLSLQRLSLLSCTARFLDARAEASGSRRGRQAHSDRRRWQRRRAWLLVFVSVGGGGGVKLFLFSGGGGQTFASSLGLRRRRGPPHLLPEPSRERPCVLAFVVIFLGVGSGHAAGAAERVPADGRRRRRRGSDAQSCEFFFDCSFIRRGL